MMKNVLILGAAIALFVSGCGGGGSGPGSAIVNPIGYHGPDHQIVRQQIEAKHSVLNAARVREDINATMEIFTTIIDAVPGGDTRASVQKRFQDIFGIWDVQQIIVMNPSWTISNRPETPTSRGILAHYVFNEVSIYTNKITGERWRRFDTWTYQWFKENYEDPSSQWVVVYVKYGGGADLEKI